MMLRYISLLRIMGRANLDGMSESGICESRCFHFVESQAFDTLTLQIRRSKSYDGLSCLLYVECQLDHRVKVMPTGYQS